MDKDETKLTILAYYGTLAVAVETSRRLNTSAKGICGSSDGYWKQDIFKAGNSRALNSTVFLSPLTDLNQAKHDYYINNLMRVKDNRMITAHALSYRTGGGYMLSLGVSYLSLILDFTYPTLSEFSIELWVKLSVHRAGMSVGSVVKGKRVLYSIVQERSSLTVWYDNQLVITWGSYEINTRLVLKHSVWTHLSLTWRSSDGRLALMLADIDGFRSKSTHYGILINNLFHVDRGFFLGYDNKRKSSIGLTLEFDELRVWQFSRKDEDIIKTMTVKILSYIDGLVIFCGFDEGYGETTNGTLYAVRDNATMSGYYHRGNKTRDQKIAYESKPQGFTLLWKPSGAPYPNLGHYQMNIDGSDAVQSEAKKKCRELFYTGYLHKYCGKRLVTQTLFYYEACLLDVVHSGDIKHTKISVSMFAFYCQKVLEIPACNLHGFYDGFPACEEDPGFDVVLIVSISVGAFIFMILLAICIIFLCRRRNKESLGNGEHSRGVRLKHVPSSYVNKDVEDDHERFRESDVLSSFNHGLVEGSAEDDGGKRLEENSF